MSLLKNGPGYDVVLSRLKGKESGWKAGLGLKVDVSELAQKATKALDEITDFTGPKLKKIKPFLSPGTYALEKLDTLLDKAVGELLKDDALAKALKADLGLLLGGKPGDKLALESALKDKLTSAIDEVTGGVTRTATDFAEETIDRLVSKLPDIVAGDLAKKGKDEVKKLTKKLVDDFTKQSKDLVANTASTNAVAREVAAIGTQAKSGAGKADDALKKVRELVAGYEAFVKDARKTLEKLAATEIGIQLESSFSKSESAHYEVLGTITDVDDDETADLWHELVLGRLQAIERMLVDPSLTPAGFDFSSKSSLKLTASSMRKRGLSISVLDKVFKVEVSAEGKAEILFKDGAVTVESTGEAKRKLSLIGLGPTRSTSFLSVLELQQFKSGGDARSVDVSIEFLRADKNLKLDELNTFLGSLGEHNLISAARSEQARDALQEGLFDAGGKKLKGDIGFRMELSPKQINTLLAIGAAASENAQVERALFLLAAKMMIGTHQMDPTRMAEALFELTKTTVLDDQLSTYWDKRNRLSAGRFGGTHDRKWKTVKPLRTAKSLFEDLAEIFVGLHKTHTALPQTPLQEGWTVDRYRKEQQKIADAASSWIKTKASIIEGKLHPAMLTMLHIFLALERGELPSGKDDIAAFVLDMARPLDPSSDASALQVTMQLGDASEPTVI